MAIRNIDGIKVRTSFEYPPIPVRSFDWFAVDDDTYDGEGPIGMGATEADAIADLLAEIDENTDTSLMQVDRGFSRSTVVMCEVDLSSGVAGQITCIECGGDGDWTKFHPEPQTLTAPLPCVECKGTGRVWVSA